MPSGLQVIMVTLLLAAVALSAAEAGTINYYHPAPALVPAPAAYYAAPAPALVRTPSLDSAVVHSERVGGNFAYSSVEGHAYTALSPVVHPAPVAIAYKAQPLVAPLPVVHAAAYPAVYAPAKSFFYAH